MKVNIKVGIISFTKKGGKLNEKICSGLKEKGLAAEGYTTNKYALGTGLHPFNKLSELMEQLFQTADGIIVIGACGIAVRGIAPFLKSKSEDPAVVVAGEDGKFVISLLSGHIGGANELSRWVAGIIKAVPVITTATDVNDKFAVDSWAVKNNLIITDVSMIKEISGAVLNGDKTGFYCEYPVKGKLPPELTLGTSDIGICVSKNTSLKPFAKTLNLVPRNIVLGIGCRRGMAGNKIQDVVTDVFGQYKLDKKRIFRVCSINLKSGEEGILKLAEAYQAEFVTFTAEGLKDVKGDFVGSEFVKNTVGVDNVCERSAVLGSHYGKKLISKTAADGVTLSACEMDYVVTFD